MIPEKLILDVFDRSWRGPWDRFGVILDAFWGPLGSLGAFWRRFGRLLGSCGGPKGALARSWVSLGGSGDVLGAFFSLLDGSWGGFGRLRGLLRVLLGCLGARLLVLNGDVTLFL